MSTSTKIETKAFKVAAVSTNTNSFGLQGMILIARDGEAWQVGANYINVKPKGAVIHVPAPTELFSGFGFEIPERLPNAPQGVVDEVW